MITMGRTQISLIQEPYVNRNTVLGLTTNKGRIIVGTTSCNPRACIFVSKEINAMLLPQLSGRDLVAMTMKIKVNKIEREIVVASVYLPYDTTSLPPTDEFSNLVRYCTDKKLELIIGCDSNSHHSVWGSSDTNNRGRALLEYLAGSQLNILNKGHRPTFSNTLREEVIDLTLATEAVEVLVTNWHVSRNILTSDHRCISFNLQTDTPDLIPRRNPKATNWKIYCSEMASGIKEWKFSAKTIEDVERSTNNLMSIIKTAYEKASPIRKPKETKYSPWWNKELRTIQKRVRKLLNKAEASKSEADWGLFRATQKEYKKCLRIAKRDSWRKFCQSIESIPEISRLHRAFSKNSHIQLESLQLPNGEYTSTKEEAVKHLLKVHFPGSVLIDGNIEIDNDLIKVDSQIAWKTANVVVSKKKVEWAVNSFEPFKSAGPDEIFPALLQKGLMFLCDPLCQLFQATIAMGYIPRSWRSTKVVFIPKPGRESYFLAKSFRPISLSSFLLKTQEKLIDRYIRDHCLTKIPLNENQHAYRKGKSVESALHHLVSKLERASDQKAYAVGTFVDIEGAFDSTNFDSIVKASLSHGVDDTIIKWITAMLGKRNVYAIVGDSKVEVRVQQGCPQGGVLSPLLWSMVINELLNKLNSAGYYTQGYADDIAVVISGKCLNTLSYHSQRALNIIEKWCINQKLTVNSSKTEIVIFTRSRKDNNMRIPRIFGKSVTISEKIKYLGVTIDKKLNWAAHLENKLKKATISFWHCRRAFGKTWGLKPKVILWLYTAIVRPMFSYGAIVWWSRIRKTTARKQLDHLQRLACMGVTGAMRTTPTAALEVCLSLLPLDIYIEGKAKATALRLYTGNEWNVFGTPVGHSMILSELVEEDPNLLMPYDCMVPAYDFNIPYSVQYPSREDWLDTNRLPPKFGYTWYTDGSLKEGKSGCGVHLDNSNTNISIPLGNYCTVFQAEITAIIHCANKITDMGLHNQHIYICSDSQAALKSLEAPMIKSKLVQECRQALKTITKYNLVRLVWVPGHSDVVGNDRADELARKGSEAGLVGPEPAISLSLSFAKQSIKKILAAKHVVRWKNLSTCRQTKTFIEQPNMGATKYILSLDRCNINKLIGVLTGHAKLNRHLTTIGILQNPMCACLEDENETAEHYLCECPAFSSIRKRTLGHAVIRPEQIKQLPLKMVMNFINSTGRFDEEG